ncbi:MAG: GNAT family N-acetyltransferase [Ruminococcus sp.]
MKYKNIRPASAADASRIAEMIVVNYRRNFYPFFKNDAFYFGELNVMSVASEYSEGSQALKNSYVYDDGVVRGVIRVSGREIEKLYVEPQFQSKGIGAALLEFALGELNASELWALEYNKRGIAFYERNGFSLTGEKFMEEGWIPLLKMKHL